MASFLDNFLVPFLSVSTALFLVGSIFYILRLKKEKVKNLDTSLNKIVPTNRDKYYSDQFSMTSDFFHNNPNLGLISTRVLELDTGKLNRTALEITKLLDSAATNPRIPDAIFDWLVKNMKQDQSEIQDYLMILFNKIAEYNSGYFNYYLGLFIHKVIENNLSQPNEVYKEVFEKGNRELKNSIVNYVVKERRFNISKDIFISLLKNSKGAYKNEDEFLRRISDEYAEYYNENPEDLLKFFSAILPSVTSFNYDSIDVLFEFLLKFLVKVAIINASDLEKLAPLNNYIKKKFGILLKILLNNRFKPKPDGNKIEKTKWKIYSSLAIIGFNQWDLGIGTIGTGREINNKFWITSKGEKSELIQRDFLNDFFPYLIYLYNEEYEKLDLENDKKLWDMIIKMLTFNSYSIIGYVAVLTICFLQVKQNNLILLIKIFNRLKEENSESSRFFMAILADNLSKINKDDKAFNLKILSLTRDLIIPHLLEGDNPPNIYFFVDTPGINIIEYWEEYKSVFEVIFNTLDNKQLIDKVNEKFAFVCFLPDKIIGKTVLKYLLEKKMHLNKLWKESTFKFIAGMYLRDKEFTLKLLIENGIDKNVINEWSILKEVDNELIKIKDTRSYQANWNELFVYAFVRNKKLRFYVIRDLIGGLAQSNTGEEFAEEFRRFAINAAKSFILKEFENEYDQKINIDLVFEVSEAKRIIGRGKLYKPRTIFKSQINME